MESGESGGKDINRVLILGGGFGGVAAERIAALFAVRPAESAFVGEGGCFLGVSGDQAVMVRGQFLAEPAPDVEITVEPPDILDARRAFETRRLSVRF